ncbi:MAG: SAM-dependent methyltransferase [Prevotella sp.]|nr:SAM-dependent methyltransferase [Prevotella sp.]
MNEQTRDFIRENADKDIRLLALSAKKNPDVDLSFALDQIAGRQTARQKLPSWAATDDIVYPPHLSMEQCSSEQTARYKMKLSSPSPHPSSKPSHPSSLIDLTGGFGVDFSFMSRGFERAVYVERLENLCDIARHNFALLGMDNAEVVCGDGVDYLKSLDRVSVIYLDPARRNEHGGKTYAISDCTPDVIELKDLLLQKADRVIVKLSPMLDWHKAISDLGDAVAEVHIVSVDNECKELLLVMQSPEAEDVSRKTVKVVCVNNEEEFVFWSVGVKECWSENCLTPNPSPKGEGSSNKLSSLIPHPSSTESTNSSTCQLVNSSTESPFLYEPNASIMKAGCFSAIEQTFGVKQLERNSHLFVSESFVEDFPGRKFLIRAVTTMNKKDIKKALSGIDKANISVRNFPISVAELRKRLKIKEGGSDYIFATTLIDKSHVLLLCSRL